jgi:hypothetical protein
MSLIGIAGCAGTTNSNLQKLIGSGEGSPGLAARLGTTTRNITGFINGAASPGIARLLGTTTSNAQLLRNLIGREGAVGLIIGLACGLNESSQH